MPYLRDSAFTAAEGIEPVPVLKKTGSTEKAMAGTNTNDSAEQVDKSNEQVIEDRMDTAEPTSSQMPSPPDSRSPTPRYNLDICPKRLYPLIPPKNYGAIFKHTMFRSSFPQRENIEFLQSLGLRSILTLTTKNDPCETYSNFVRECSIRHKIMELETNKEGAINMKPDNLCEAILYALNPAHRPIYVHCNQGRHRTGCFVACIRKIQGWSLDEVLVEYDTYASPKPRDGDIAFIKQFDPAVVSEFADRNPHLKWRSDSMLGTFDLMAGLGNFDPTSQLAEGSVVSDTSEPGLIMAAPRAIDPALTNGTANVLKAYETVFEDDSEATEDSGDAMEDVAPSASPEDTALARVSARS